MQIDSLANYVLGKYDANHDGVIEDKQGEYDRTATGICNTPYTADTFFRSADKNRDGKVTRDELRAGVAKYDANGNGEIDAPNWFQRNVLGLFWGNKPTEYSNFLNSYESETNTCD